MGLINDILDALDRIPIWKRLQSIPPEVDELRKQVVALEHKLSGKWPPDVCRYCGERAARLTYVAPSLNAQGIKIERWTCSACNKVEPRQIKVA